MRLLYLLIIAGIVLGTYFTVKVVTERRLSERLARIQTWKELPYPERFVEHTEHAADIERKDAARTQAAITFSVTVFLTTVAMVAWLQDTVTANRVEIERACRVDTRFREILDARLEDEIRVKQNQRDQLADEMAEDARLGIESVAGFDELLPQTQRFVINLVDAQESEQRGRLAELDVDLDQLRTEKTTIREFNAQQDCPT